YEICSVIGWPFETGAALARLVFSGIMDRFPNLKVIAHHLGGIIPYFEGRVAHSWDQLGTRTSDEDYSLILKKLKKRPFDYFKGVYGDTALAGARARRRFADCRSSGLIMCYLPPIVRSTRRRAGATSALRSRSWSRSNFPRRT